MERLDPLLIPLNHFNLIEASAGTGKTYTITALYLRLVVEAAIPVNRILVVTYTNAATKELRDRIRERLGQLRLAFLRGYAPEDDELATRLLDLMPDRELAIRRLTNAARGFDEAAIFTIHGFCKRVLGDNAFESGLSFETELMADTGDLLQEIVDDFWRREFYTASASMVGYFLDQRYSPERLRDEIARHLGKPYLQVVTPEETADGATLERIFVDAFREAKDYWLHDRAGIEDLLLNTPLLNRQKYGRKSLAAWLEALDRYLMAEAPKPALFEKFEKFTTAELQKSLKGKSGDAPKHAFFTACDTLKTACEALARYYQHQMPARLLEYCNAELALRKRRQQVQSYDDLLLNLHAALRQGRQAEKLVQQLRRRYFAALIDEFQDTDPVQYAIFRRIYAGTGKPVFLVGDPKQAIYSFRGADIFAYLAARRDASRRYTLDVNWRSEPRLLTALNTVFGATGRQPFFFEEIPFHKALAAGRKQQEFLWLQGQLEPPFQVWLLESGSDKPLGRGVASERVVQATVAEIARLLNLGARGEARIGESSLVAASRNLTGGDIAVLVRSHRQGRLIQNALLRLGVPSVQQADSSVFVSEETRQMGWLLAAVAEPGNEGGVRTLLASDFFGLSGEALYQLREDEQAWARWLEKLQDYRQLWLDYGFMRFFRAWLIGEGIPQRLLAFRDGERRLTNLLHLAELLHVASFSHPGLAELCKWLNTRWHLPQDHDEEQQLRLESDEQLVRIVTVHKSKGLEYPVVFCPFLWDGKLKADSENSQPLLYHDPLDPSRAFLAFGVGEDDPSRQLARHEEMAERLRLFYVALTRAKQRCYVAWGKIKDAETAPPAWLLHHPPVVGPSQDVLEITQQRFRDLTASGFHSDLHQVFATAREAVTVLSPTGGPRQRHQPVASVESVLKARIWEGLLTTAWRVESFTGLIAGQSSEMPDYDMVADTVTVEVLETAGKTEVGGEEGDTASSTVLEPNMFDFPRGTRAGICLHAIFERLDFTQRDRTRLEELTRSLLQAHGFDATTWGVVVADMVQRVVDTPLDANDLRLATVAPERRLNELEFYYPLANLRVEALRRVLEQNGYASGPLQKTMEGLEFTPLQGYMKGFIDLVFEAEGRFYLADYKSNWLGPELAAYRRSRLEEAMVRNAYLLQYLIYTVALHRYLRLRLPDYHYERHFGGVFYLFLRGMDPRQGQRYGIFHDRPPSSLITALDRLMATGKTV